MLTTDHAAQRGRDAFGTATRISASLLRRLSAFFGSAPDQDPKAATYAVLIPDPGRFANVRNNPRVMIAPRPKRPCFDVWAVVCGPVGEGECVPTFRCESERGAFVREVENCDKKRFETAL